MFFELRVVLSSIQNTSWIPDNALRSFFFKKSSSLQMTVGYLFLTFHKWLAELQHSSRLCSSLIKRPHGNHCKKLLIKSCHPFDRWSTKCALLPCLLLTSFKCKNVLNISWFEISWWLYLNKCWGTPGEVKVPRRSTMQKLNSWVMWGHLID